VQAEVDALSGADMDNADADQELLMSRTRKALEKLAKTSLPDLSLRDLRDEYQLQNDPSGRTGLDEVAYMAELRRRLEAAEPVADGDLVTLAENRQASIRNELRESGAQAELGEVQEVKLSKADRVRIELTLEAGTVARPDAAASDATGTSP
jgi:hypothetical protein